MTRDEIELDELLIVACLNPRKPGESLRDAVLRLIHWEVSIALDPAVSSAAQALIERGKQQALQEANKDAERFGKLIQHSSLGIGKMGSYWSLNVFGDCPTPDSMRDVASAVDSLPLRQGS